MSSQLWKLEQGHREPKLAEAVAIGRSLGLWSWTELTVKPATFNLGLAIDQWRHRVNELAQQTRATAAAQIDALLQLAFAVRAAVEADPPGEWAERRSFDWLELTPEATVLREVLAARVAWESEDAEGDRRMAEQERLEEQIMTALEKLRVPLVIQPEDIKTVRPEPSAPESEHHHEGRTPAGDS